MVSYPRSNIANTRRNAKASWADVPAEGEEVEALMRIAGCPQENVEKQCVVSPRGHGHLLEQLGKIASPQKRRAGQLAGRGQFSAFENNAAACSPSGYASPFVPPPPPVPPSWSTIPQNAGPVLQGMSYREKLRAGGQGALMRANEAGLGNSYRQQDEWSSWNAQGAPWPEDQQNMTMPYAGEGQGPFVPGAGNQWGSAGQMQSNDCWGFPVEPPQMPAQYPYAQQPHQLQLPQMPPPMPLH